MIIVMIYGKYNALYNAMMMVMIMMKIKAWKN